MLPDEAVKSPPHCGPEDTVVVGGRVVGTVVGLVVGTVVGLLVVGTVGGGVVGQKAVY